MKKILAVLLLAGVMSSASAHEGWRHGGGHYVYRDGMGWVVPAIIGGAIVYGATRPVQPNVVVVQPTLPPPTYAPAQPPYGYHWEAILDSNCNCYRTVAVPN